MASTIPRSLEIRWPSCQAMWFIPSTGRMSRSASSRSPRYRVTSDSFRLSVCRMTSLACMERDFQGEFGSSTRGGRIGVQDEVGDEELARVVGGPPLRGPHHPLAVGAEHGEA